MVDLQLNTGGIGDSSTFLDKRTGKTFSEEFERRGNSYRIYSTPERKELHGMSVATDSDSCVPYLSP